MASLIFNEGYTSSDGAQLQCRAGQRSDPIDPVVHRSLPADGEVAGLLALMLLDGRLLPCADRHRTAR